MNKNNAKDFLPLVQALADGKTIQFYTGSWVDLSSVDETSFTLPPERYRIKPEPKLRKWEPEEFKPFALYRDIGFEKGWAVPVGYNSGKLWFVSTCVGLVWHDADRLLKIKEHSTDGGKSWHPCGILES